MSSSASSSATAGRRDSDGSADGGRSRGRIPALLSNFSFQVIAALFLGLLLGLIARAIGGDPETSPNILMTVLDIIGSTYVTILTAAVVPLVVTAVIASIANLDQVTNAARLAWKTLLWFCITALIAVVIGMVLGVVVQPGANQSISAPTEPYSGTQGSWLAFLQSLVPVNFLGLGVEAELAEDGAIEAAADFNILQILVISMVVGIAALKVGEPAKPFLDVVRSLLAIVQKVLWWIIRLAPIGTLGLIGRAVFEYGWTSMGSLAVFVVTLYVGLAIVLFVVYPVLMRLNGLSVRQWFSGAWPAIQMGFVSRSSLGTMPLTQRVTERNLGVPSSYASFAIPLGATTKMDGCAAVYPALAAIFVAQFYGVPLEPVHFLLIALVSVLGSAATAGTTGATVMLTLTLSTLGLPLAGVGLLLSIEPIIDMGRTATNVAGQTVVAAIVSEREGILDHGLYDARRSGGDPFADESQEPAAARGRVEAAADDSPDIRVPDETASARRATAPDAAAAHGVAAGTGPAAADRPCRD
ncbi:dicarboxylate/amino acid:cation symporter [Kocuria palustris]|uniref:dicarboxylate/amino acid:cation symporter n=1 Tax=Kocuria palustris TaxID=71999 RepID=UPI0011A6DE2E|nr:dicarboxylate/amino acid:cation symporter [Kocuria palustris]